MWGIPRAHHLHRATSTEIRAPDRTYYCHHPPKRFMRRVLAPRFVLLGLALAACPAFAAGKLKYNRDVRPILSDKCFYCHGPDKNHREGDLRLDVREDAVKAKAIVPGDPAKSAIIERIHTEDEDDLMPPPESKKELSDREKKILQQWIAEGADYEPHWAYTPLARPKVPREGVHPVDAFIQAELGEHGIQPAPEADARALIRRVSLDLTGLPPDEGARADVAGWSGARYEALVDRLLASPHFGERWASWWLDAVRYADTVGFHGDQNQRIFPYRDYVIDAFNSNKRFDQFTFEQIAGDLLPNPAAEQLVATGFNRLNMMTREGGAQEKEYLAKYQADRVRTLGSAWLGSTMVCCECHDHKFDPLTMRDFYSLSAYFADLKQFGVYADYKYTPNPELRGWTNDHPFPPEIEITSQSLLQRMKKLEGQMERVASDALAAWTKDGGNAGKLSEWRRGAASFLAANPDGWAKMRPSTVLVDQIVTDRGVRAPKLPPGQYEVGADGRVIIHETHLDQTTLTYMPGAARVAALRIQVLPDPMHRGSIQRGGRRGESFLQPLIRVQRKSDKKPAEIAIRHADADHKLTRFVGTAEAIGVKAGWKIPADRTGQPLASVWLLAEPLELREGDGISIRFTDQKIGCFLVSMSPFAPNDLLGTGWAAELRTGLEASGGNALPVVADAFLKSTAFDRAALEKAAATYQSWLECRNGRVWTQVAVAVKEPMTVRILKRGNWQDESGEIMRPATLGILPALPAPGGDGRQTRLDLAKWLCSKENPLTPRAFANRLWKQFFGNALSAVVDDLGMQGETPSHPELLDWLAADFRDSGWDFKRLVKTIVMSAAYRQDSKARPELRELDPQNRLLAFQNPRRLDAEFVRDNALAISGLLTPDIGGPSAKPYQPADYYENLQFPNRDYTTDTDDRQWRRGLYMHWQRTFLHPMLANFDAPSRDEAACTRNVSNTPQQALTLLNDPTFVEAAKVLAVRVIAEPADEARLTAVFQHALARPPKEKEQQSLLAFLATQRAAFKSAPDDARKLLATGLTPPPAGDTGELAAWTSLCRVVLNLHETITRY